MVKGRERNYYQHALDKIVVVHWPVAAEVADKLTDWNTTSGPEDVNNSAGGDCTDGSIGGKSAFRDVRGKMSIHWRRDDDRNRLDATDTGRCSNRRFSSVARDRVVRGIKSVAAHHPAWWRI
jgi:hypothetical protein